MSSKNLSQIQTLSIGNGQEPLSEVIAMREAVKNDAAKASSISDRIDLESLGTWLDEQINSQLS